MQSTERKEKRIGCTVSHGKLPCAAMIYLDFVALSNPTRERYGARSRAKV
jgi:hypothetical protein